MPCDAADREFFQRNGYLVRRRFVDEAAVERMIEAVTTAEERDDRPNPLTLDTMRFRSNLFYSSRTLQDFLSSEPIVSLVGGLLETEDLWVRWDQAVWKEAGAPEFPWHQDNGYTELPVVHLQVWLALTRSTIDNGGLVVAPGQHTVRHAHRWVGRHVSIDAPVATMAIDADPGDLVVFSSMLPHHTPPNRTESTRLAYVAEYLPAEVDDPGVPLPHLVVARRGRGTTATPSA